MKRESKESLKAVHSPQKAWRGVRDSGGAAAGCGGNALCAAVAKSPDKSLEPSMLHSAAGKWSCGDIYLFRHILICGESRGYK